ncbi:5-dehydro-2-deoxygluconokinase [Streptomyces eurocidicus]|uniref:5-dehydro-2-deoxygluconokinase n=1 Tax=Streptomyces eurocidicus TaxID=66423 RepID=A0A7W8F1W1_STREU|nr:5-dehydro-2-deoxygluconokinase [Streptomyces eurocidicus]
MTEPRPYDLLAMGRVGVDLYPLRTGVPLARVDTFGRFLGGSAANVAVAAARLGRRVALLSRTGADPFGDYVHEALRDFGVDDRWVTPVPGLPTPVTFCEMFPPDDFPLYFYRRPKAPDLEIRTPELDLDALRAARILWVTGTGLCEEPSRAATLAALAARAKRGTTVFDLDWRPLFWGGAGGASTDGGATGAAAMATARPFYAAALAHTTVAVGNADECEVATGERDPYAAAWSLLDAGVELAVVKQGPKGVLAVHRDGTTVEVPPVPVEVVNGLGAGDAFGGALCHGLLAGWDLERVVRYANAAGALVATRIACSSAMPTAAEVEALLAAPPRGGAGGTGAGAPGAPARGGTGGPVGTGTDSPGTGGTRGPAETGSGPAEDTTGGPTGTGPDPTAGTTGDPAGTSSDPAESTTGGPAGTGPHPSAATTGGPTGTGPHTTAGTTGDPAGTSSDPAESTTGGPADSGPHPSAATTGDPTDSGPPPTTHTTSSPTGTGPDPTAATTSDPTGTGPGVPPEGHPAPPPQARRGAQPRPKAPRRGKPPRPGQEAPRR